MKPEKDCSNTNDARRRCQKTCQGAQTHQSALTRFDSVTLGLISYQGWSFRSTIRADTIRALSCPLIAPDTSCSPQACEGRLNSAAPTATARALECPGEVPFAETTLIIPLQPVGEFHRLNNHFLELHLYTN